MKSTAQCIRSMSFTGANFVLLLLLTLSAEAHDPGLSTATVTVEDRQVEVLLGFAKQDAVFILPANANPGDIETPEGFQVVRTDLESVTASGFDSYLGEERVVPLQTTAQLTDTKNIEILLRFRRTNATQLGLRSMLLERFPFGHREFLSVQTATGTTLAQACFQQKKTRFRSTCR